MESNDRLFAAADDEFALATMASKIFLEPRCDDLVAEPIESDFPDDFRRSDEGGADILVLNGCEWNECSMVYDTKVMLPLM